MSRGAFLLGTLLLATSASSGVAQPSQRSLVYGGDQSFPPYEYLDESGRPEGFNIHLIRAMAREAGMVGHASFHTAGPMGPSMSERSNGDFLSLATDSDKRT